MEPWDQVGALLAPWGLVSSSSSSIWGRAGGRHSWLSCSPLGRPPPDTPTSLLLPLPQRSQLRVCGSYRSCPWTQDSTQVDPKGLSSTHKRQGISSAPFSVGSWGRGAATGHSQLLATAQRATGGQVQCFIWFEFFFFFRLLIYLKTKKCQQRSIKLYK